MSENASDEEIKKAYRDLARKYHPDNYHDNPLADLAQEKMKEINAAYEQITKEQAPPASGRAAPAGPSYGSFRLRRVRRLSGLRRIWGLPELQRSELRAPAGPHRHQHRQHEPGGGAAGQLQRPQCGVELPEGRRSATAGAGWTRRSGTTETACQMDPSNAEYRQALEYMEGTDDSGLPPRRTDSFGTACAAETPAMSLCCAYCCATLRWRRLLLLLLRDQKRGSRDHMIKSMTGYGRARQELHKRDITVEVRSVNNRYLDCTVKMPRMYAFAEDAVKKRVQQAVSRGKVDVFITVDAICRGCGQGCGEPGAGGPVCRRPGGAVGASAATADYRPAPETLARFPDVLTVTKADEDLETVSADLCAVLGRGAGRVQ